MGFKDRYTFTAKEAIYTPLLYRAGLESLGDVPHPTQSGMKDLANFSGISDGAVRTALSRGKGNGSIIPFQDSEGVTRFRISDAYFEMGLTAINRDRDSMGITLAVFSFTKDDVAERAFVRENLKNYGFKRLAQNTYINGKIETAGLLRDMKEQGLEKHFYLFHCPNVEDSGLKEKIIELFDLERRTEILNVFYEDMVGFLGEKDLDDLELGRRMLYFGTVYWTECQVNEPPLPRQCLPENYPIEKINDYYNEFTRVNIQKLMNYYRTVNK